MQQRDREELAPSLDVTNCVKTTYSTREEQQRAHELPEVAEHRAEEAQLELLTAMRPRQEHEAPPVARQRRRAGRPAGRAARRRSGALMLRDWHGVAGRSMASSWGRSTMPPPAAGLATSTENIRAQRSTMSWPEPAREHHQRRVVAPGREDATNDAVSVTTSPAGEAPRARRCRQPSRSRSTFWSRLVDPDDVEVGVVELAVEAHAEP